MLPTVALIFDLLLAGLLIATIVYAIILNRQFINLRDSRSEMEALIRSFNEATIRAEIGVKAMRRTSLDTGESLQKTVERAAQLRDELNFMIDAADTLAQRLAEVPTRVRPATATLSAAPQSSTHQSSAHQPSTRRPQSQQSQSQSPQPARRLPDLERNDHDLPQGREVPPRTEAPAPRFESRRPSEREQGQDLPRGRGILTRGTSDQPEPSLFEQARPEQTRPEQTRPEQARPDQARPEQTRRPASRGDAAERPILADESRPSRREGGEGLSRAERELLAAIENRR